MDLCAKKSDQLGMCVCVRAMGAAKGRDSVMTVMTVIEGN